MPPPEAPDDDAQKCLANLRRSLAALPHEGEALELLIWALERELRCRERAAGESTSAGKSAKRAVRDEGVTPNDHGHWRWA